MTLLRKLFPTPTAPTEERASAALAAQWAEARQLYPIYAGLVRQFELGVADCPELAAISPPRDKAALLPALAWLDEVDRRIQVHQLRQFLQSSPLVTEENLRALNLRHLQKPNKIQSDRDKVDFLLVQYFALCAPEKIFSHEIELQEVAEVLQPILGEVEATPLEWCIPLEIVLDALKEFHSLHDLFDGNALGQGRSVKESAGDMFYDPSALVAFCRFNFLLRRTIIRLMHADLQAIREGLAGLESGGALKVNCREAGLSAAESLAALQQFCQEWKQPYGKNYTEQSVRQAFAKLLGVRAAVEAALLKLRPEKPATSGTKTTSPPPTPLPKSVSESPRRAAGAATPQKPQATPPKAARSEPGSTRAKPAPLQPAPLAAPQTARPAATAVAVPHAKASEASDTALMPPDLEACLESIWEQLISAPPSRGRSMTSVVVEDVRVLLSSWEVAAFVSEGGQVAEDLRRAVVARAVLSAALEATKRGRRDSVEEVLNLARSEIGYLQGRAEQAKSAKNTEAAVNLAISAKRLLSVIEEAEALKP